MLSQLIVVVFLLQLTINYTASITDLAPSPSPEAMAPVDDGLVTDAPASEPSPALPETEPPPPPVDSSPPSSPPPPSHSPPRPKPPKSPPPRPPPSNETLDFLASVVYAADYTFKLTTTQMKVVTDLYMHAKTPPQVILAKRKLSMAKKAVQAASARVSSAWLGLMKQGRRTWGKQWALRPFWNQWMARYHPAQKNGKGSKSGKKNPPASNTAKGQTKGKSKQQKQGSQQKQKQQQKKNQKQTQAQSQKNKKQQQTKKQQTAEKTSGSATTRHKLLASSAGAYPSLTPSCSTGPYISSIVVPLSTCRSPPPGKYSRVVT